MLLLLLRRRSAREWRAAAGSSMMRGRCRVAPCVRTGGCGMFGWGLAVSSCTAGSVLDWVLFPGLTAVLAVTCVLLMRRIGFALHDKCAL